MKIQRTFLNISDACAACVAFRRQGFIATTLGKSALVELEDTKLATLASAFGWEPVPEVEPKPSRTAAELIAAVAEFRARRRGVLVGVSPVHGCKVGG